MLLPTGIVCAVGTVLVAFTGGGPFEILFGSGMAALPIITGLRHLNRSQK